MNPYRSSAAKPTQPLPTTAAHKQRIRERMKGQSSNLQAERPTFAYYVVYFTTVAVLVTLSVVAALH